MTNQQPVKMGEHEKALALGQINDEGMPASYQAKVRELLDQGYSVEDARARADEMVHPVDNQKPVPVGQSKDERVPPPDMADPNNNETYYVGDADAQVKPNAPAAVKTSETPNGARDQAKPEKVQQKPAKQAAKAQQTHGDVKRDAKRKR